MSTALKLPTSDKRTFSSVPNPPPFGYLEKPELPTEANKTRFDQIQQENKQPPKAKPQVDAGAKTARLHEELWVTQPQHSKPMFAKSLALALMEKRDYGLEAEFISSSRRLAMYGRLLADAARDTRWEQVREKTLSYFETETQPALNRAIALAIIKAITERVYSLEAAIAKNAELAVKYAIATKMRKFPAAEATLMAHPQWGVEYAMRVIRDRWSMGEAAIRCNPAAWNRYSRQFSLRY